MDQFAGYSLHEKLGAGGTAVVFRARKGDGPVVALKILHDQGVTEQMRTRFQREVDALRKVDHPGILKVLDAGREGDRLWYAMEFSEKRSLEAVLQERLAKGGILEVEECLTLARGLADSLAYLHSRRVVHRDLKPDNLLVDEAFHPTLMDFGLAKDQERSEMTAEGMVMGTPRYMAPEQTQGRPAEAPADVYQVGLILYRALTGKLPLEDENPFATAMRRMREAIPPPSQERPTIPPGLDRILLKALKFAASDRYPDMGALKEELERLDPRTGALRDGLTMPGALAERAPAPQRGEATIVAGAPGFRTMTGDTNPPITPSSAAPPASRRGLVWGAGFGLGALGLALVLALGRPGAKAAPPVVRGLHVTLAEGKAQVYFETDRPTRSFLRLDPPDGRLYPIMAEASKLHAATLEDLDETHPDRYQLVFEEPGGARFDLPPADLGEAAGAGGGLGLGIQERRQGDHASVQLTTRTPATCRLFWGTGGTGGALDQRATARLTGDTVHVFELGPLPEGEDVDYQIEIDEGGTLRKSSRQRLGR